MFPSKGGWHLVYKVPQNEKPYKAEGSSSHILLDLSFHAKIIFSTNFETYRLLNKI